MAQHFLCRLKAVLGRPQEDPKLDPPILDSSTPVGRLQNLKEDLLCWIRPGVWVGRAPILAFRGCAQLGVQGGSSDLSLKAAGSI